MCLGSPGTPALHKSVHYENSDHLLRYPTYNTAGIVEVDNHHSPITTLTPVVSYTDSDSAGQDSHEDSSGGLTFQLVSCEEMGILKFWVVAEISSPDMAGSEVDLGLSPGGRIKLVLSSSMKLRNPLREKTETTKEKQGYLRTFELQLSPGDLNHYYVGTEKGFVYHGLRLDPKLIPECSQPSVMLLWTSGRSTSPRFVILVFWQPQEMAMFIYSAQKQTRPLCPGPPVCGEPRG